jgi:hypothetical protein
VGAVILAGTVKKEQYLLSRLKMEAFVSLVFIALKVLLHHHLVLEAISANHKV